LDQNLYDYCRNKPIVNVDPNGENPIIIGIVAGSLIGILLWEDYIYPALHHHCQNPDDAVGGDPPDQWPHTIEPGKNRTEVEGL